MELWEILVPTTMGDTGKPIRTRYHRVWDKYVRKISGGLTVLKPVKGQWVYRDELVEERMIPVRICADKSEIEAVIQFTLKHYRQIAVMAYKISNEVLIIHKKDE